MNLRDIKYIVTVAEARNFTKAAKFCNVSQPTLSTQIHKVEESLDTKIFERIGNSIKCTPIGLKIVNHANIILAHADAIYEISRVKEDLFAGKLRLGVFPTLAPYYLPKIIPVFTERYPQLELILKEEKTGNLLDMLVDGIIDLAFLSLPIKSDSLEVHKIFSEPFYLCINKNNALNVLEEINYCDLHGQKILLLDEGHCMREQALDICKMVSPEQRHNYGATSLETLREMVSANMGITLMPKMAMRNHENIRYIPFSVPEPSRDIALVWRTGSPRHQLLKKILRTFTTLHSN
jgi:LysR family transcriptional regulator, hydrogen peroxide-inducible genes activator